jgi:hypothetical protein
MTIDGIYITPDEGPSLETSKFSFQVVLSLPTKACSLYINIFIGDFTLNRLCPDYIGCSIIPSSDGTA